MTMEGSVNEETVDLLIENILKTYKMLNERSKTRKHVTFSDIPIIKDEHIYEVNCVFDKLDSKKKC